MARSGGPAEKVVPHSGRTTTGVEARQLSTTLRGPQEPLFHGPRLQYFFLRSKGRVLPRKILRSFWKSFRSSIVLRLQNLAGLRMNLLVIDLARFPATAESFHQIDGANHLLAEQLRLQPLAS